MRDLNELEVANVSGGVISMEALVAVGSILAFAYMVGKDLAERDNALQCSR